VHGYRKNNRNCRSYQQIYQNKPLKILSIISRITLGDQHVKSFHDKDINLFTYNNGMQKDKHFVVRVNSLLIMTYLTNAELSNYKNI
jgi:hypothetical protein